MEQYIKMTERNPDTSSNNYDAKDSTDDFNNSEDQQTNTTTTSDSEISFNSSENESSSSSNNIDSTVDENSEDIEDPNNLEKMILSTGIRVGTPIKTKYMTPFITRANPEGLYILDISKTLARIDVAAKFIGRTNIVECSSYFFERIW